MNTITVILILVIILLIVALVTISYKYYNTKTLYELDRADMIYHKNKISMIEYTYRKYREGQNPFTTLREMSNILKDFYPKSPKE